MIVIPGLSRSLMPPPLLAVSDDWNQRQHDCTGMIRLTIQPSLDYRGGGARYLFPWNSDRR